MLWQAGQIVRDIESEVAPRPNVPVDTRSALAALATFGLHKNRELWKTDGQTPARARANPSAVRARNESGTKKNGECARYMPNAFAPSDGKTRIKIKQIV